MLKNGVHGGRDYFKCSRCGSRLVTPTSAGELRRTRYTAEELMSLAAEAVPLHLPAEIREEVKQAIILDLLSRKVEAGALSDSRFIRKHVRAAYGLQDGYKFRPLDSPAKEGKQPLGDLIAA